MTLLSSLLAQQNRVLGILDVQSDQKNAFTPEDVFTLESLAGQLSIALHEAQTYDAEYVALAQLQKAALVTLDADLVRSVEGIVPTASIDALR